MNSEDRKDFGTSLPTPVSIRGTVVAALFKWMVVSSSLNSNISENIPYLIPWHHIHSKSFNNEKRGYDVMSRVRSYLLTNPVAFVPEQNLPLLVHAIALFDAHQLHSIFRAWKALWCSGSLLDRFNRRNSLSRLLSTWIRFTQRRCALRIMASTVEWKISLARKKVIWKDWFSAWKLERLRRRGESSLKLAAFVACRRLRYSRVLQRMGQQSAELFLYRKTLLSCLVQWIRRINRAFFAFTYGNRYDFLASLQPTDGYLLSNSKMLLESAIREKTAGLKMAVLKAIVLNQCRLLWARTHRGALQRILSGRTMSFTYAGSGQLSVLREMCDTVECSLDPVQNLPVFISSVHCNLSSRSAQNVLGQVGGMYRKYNALINAFRLWIYRTPQLKMLRGNREIVQLRVNRNLSHSFDTDSFQNSSSIVGRNISLNSKGLTDKSCMDALRKWKWFSGRSRFLRIAASAVRTLSDKNVVTRCVGGWLVFAANRERLRRAGNRLVCNRFKRSCWHAYFAWRTVFERSTLIRSNQKQLVTLRRREIESFIAEHSTKRSQCSQQDIMRQWSLVTRDRKRGRILTQLWSQTAGRRFLFSAFMKWNTIVQVDIIVTCLKSLWRRYKVRHISHVNIVCYLQSFKRNIRIYMSFRKKLFGKRVFSVMKAYYREYVLAVRTKRFAEISCARGLLKFIHNWQRRAHAYRYLLKADKLSRLSLLNRALMRLRESTKRHKINEIRRKIRKRKLKKSLLIIAKRRYLRFCELKSVHFFEQARKRKSVMIWCDWAVQHMRIRFRMRALIKQDMREAMKAMRIQASRNRLNRRTVRKFLMRRKMKRWIEFVQHKMERKVMARKPNRSILRMFRLVRVLLEYWLHTAKKNRSKRRKFKGKQSLHNIGKRTLPSFGLRGYQEVQLYGFSSHSDVGENRIVRSSRLRNYFLRLYQRMRRNRERRHIRYSHLANRGNTMLRYAFSKILKNWSKGQRRKVAGERTYPLSTVRKTLFQNTQYLNRAAQMFPQRYIYSRRIRIRARSPSSLAALRRRLLQNLSLDEFKLVLIPVAEKWKLRARRTAKWKRKALKVYNAFMKRFLLKLLRRWLANQLHNRRIREKVAFTLRRAKLKFLRINFLAFVMKLKKKKIAQLCARMVRTQFRSESCRKFLRILKARSGYSRKIHRSLICVRRLRSYLRLAIRMFRIPLNLRAREKSGAHVFKLKRSRCRDFFRRLKVLIKLRNTRKLMKRLLRTHCSHFTARKLIGYWKGFSQKRLQMRGINRRLYLRNCLSQWHAAYIASDRCNYIIRKVSHRINKRLKNESMLMWKLFTVRNSRLGLQAQLLREKQTKRYKLRALFAWMRVMDSSINRAKFMTAHAISNKHCTFRFFSHWVRLALRCSQKKHHVAQMAFKNLQLVARNNNYLRRMETKADKLYRIMNLVSAFNRLRRLRLRALHFRRHFRRAGQVRLLRIYMVFFRRWKRRMHIAVRSRRIIGQVGRLFPLVVDDLWLKNKKNGRRDVFNMNRTFSHWRRMCRGKVSRRRFRVLGRCVATWRAFSRRKCLVRLVGAERFRKVGKKLKMYIYFHEIVSYCRSAALSRQLVNKERRNILCVSWSNWRAAAERGRARKTAVQGFIWSIYLNYAKLLFKLWRVKAFCGRRLVRLGHTALVRHWRHLHRACSLWRMKTCKAIFLSWKRFVFSFEGQRRKRARFRHVVLKYVTRRLNDASLHIAAYFGRWKHRYGLEKSRLGHTPAASTVGHRMGWERTSVRMEKIQTQLRDKLFGSSNTSRGPSISFLSPEVKLEAVTADSRTMKGLKLKFTEAGLDDVSSVEKSHVHLSHSRTHIGAATPMSDPRGGAGPMNIYELL